MSIGIRRLLPGDAAVLERVADDVFDAPIDPERLAAYLAKPGHLMIVAIHDGEVVGQAMAVVHRHPDKPTELYVDEVGVAPTHQRQGIARQMMEALFAFGRELGCEEAWVGTEADNASAQGLYQGFGPTEVGPFIIYFYELLLL